jgi:hypothetical protein
MFAESTSVSSTNKTDHLDITEILLKVALNTINLNLNPIKYFLFSSFTIISITIQQSMCHDIAEILLKVALNTITQTIGERIAWGTTVA